MDAMAFYLLLLVMKATTATAMAKDDYLATIHCDAISSGNRGQCVVPSSIMKVEDAEYYTIELIEVHTPDGTGCRPAVSLYQDFSKNRVIFQIASTCNGTYGIKQKEAGFPYKGVCGQDNFASEGFRVIRGREAKKGQFPWMAYVKLSWKSGYRVSCGGSILNDRWILTAAHCIVKQHGSGDLPPAWAVHARTGSLDKWADYRHRPSKRLVVHPKYNLTTLAYDMALIELAEPIKWDGNHVPVCLNKRKNLKPAMNLTCIISGWGISALAKPGGRPTYPRKLLWEYDQILSREECDKIYKKYSTDYTLCGRANSEGHNGFCSADSGGPMVCKRHGKYFQYGAVSLYLAHKPCRMAGLYNHVASFYDWIKSYTPDLNQGLHG